MPTAEELIASGVEIPDDPVAIAQLLKGGDVPAADAAAEVPASDPSDSPAAAAAPETPAPAATPPAAAEAGKETPAAPAVEEEEEEKGPPRALLRGYRQKIHEQDRLLETSESEKEAALQRAKLLEDEIAALKAKAATGQEAIQERAEAIAPGVKLEGITPEKIESLRREYSDEVVDLLVGYAKAYETVQEQVDQLTAVREHEERNRLYDDIDSVPLLGVVRMTDDPNGDAWWKRAVQYQAAVKADPDFAGRTRKEIFAEVGRRMESFLGGEAVKKLMGAAPPAAAPAKAGTKPAAPSPKQVIDEALEQARKAAVPTSLSDIPAAGQAVAADGMARLEAISSTDLADLMDKAMARGEKSDAIIQRFLTAG